MWQEAGTEKVCKPSVGVEVVGGGEETGTVAPAVTSNASLSLIPHLDSRLLKPLLCSIMFRLPPCFIHLIYLFLCVSSQQSSNYQPEPSLLFSSASIILLQYMSVFLSTAPVFIAPHLSVCCASPLFVIFHQNVCLQLCGVPPLSPFISLGIFGYSPSL